VYQGPEGPIKIPIPFLFGPRRAWKSFSNPKRVQVKRQLQIPFLYPSQRKGIYGTLEGKSPLFLSIDVSKCRKPNPNSEHGSGKSVPRSHGKNR